MRNQRRAQPVCCAVSCKRRCGVHSLRSTLETWGDVYAQVLAMLPSPVICLSATVGDVAQLWQWLAALQQAKGHRMAPLVESTRRWNDLRLQVRRCQ